MLQIKDIHKKYTTGDLMQAALDGVSLNLRDNEFVAVLGPSGSGKTTLLNIIGGLDRYDSGDLVINNISTKRYKDRDWDSYRNHTIGFVFQSYNLIPHQSVLANVELALTISGISKGERRRRAKEALVKVGLGDQLHKKPNQMSGGQMQRVAIARALVNDPDILLADEPTGALDSETSVQVMELIQQIAKDRLVVMVTHNSELAETYANRIVRLCDGKITDDTNPFVVDEANVEPAKHENMGRASMSFLTALSLSFNNLRTKKGRTLLTAFAGSIGIIGIALILSLSTGVNDYIENIQRDTMSSYPITIEAQALDLSSLMASRRASVLADGVDHARDAMYADNSGIERASTARLSMTKNNLTAFKAYLDDPTSEIHQYTGQNGILYSYDVQYGIYTYDTEGELINTDGIKLVPDGSTSSFGMGIMMGSMSSAMSGSASGPLSSLMPSAGNFEELLPGQGAALVSAAVTESYDLLYGTWPQNHNEVVLVLDDNNEISTTVLYELGLLPASEYDALMAQINAGEQVALTSHKWSYEELCGQTFYMIVASDYYVANENGLFDYVGDDALAIRSLVKDKAIPLTISAVVRPVKDAAAANVTSAVGYTKALTDYIIAYTDESAVVVAQKASPGKSVTSGLGFAPGNDAAKVQDAIDYLARMDAQEKAAMFRDMMQAMGGEAGPTGGMLAMGDAQIAAMLDQMIASQATGDNQNILLIYDRFLSPGSYDDNMASFGVVSLDAPSSISLYADSFEAKDMISASINSYNQMADEENQITYTDYVGLLMSSVTTIIDVISYVLIAFVAVSLIVSSIMIGIITYISVLERTKEIGILRAIGASKGNISQVFNAEAFIIGLCSGLIGVGLSSLMLIPINMVVHALTETTAVNASLPIASAVVLVVLSTVLSMIAGLIPSRKAAKKEPVTALRTE